MSLARKKNVSRKSVARKRAPQPANGRTAPRKIVADFCSAGDAALVNATVRAAARDLAR